MWENLFGIFIVLLILFFCYLIVYWSFKHLYKTTIKPKVIKDKELRREIESLKQRVELLERKLDNK